ncbi:MAG: SRPBCC domain-containing protein [Alphaproteobacteria bacterium]|nr:SRPBCC domain-containing protein [Alphaproteobacteria bacterium]
MRRLFALLIAMTLPGAVHAAEGVQDTSYIAPDGSRVMRHEIVIGAPIADAWTAFTTAEGWRTWATPYATLTPAKLAFNAELVTSYNPSAAPGDETNIHHRMLSFVPERMLAFHTTRPPKGFPHPDELSQIFSVVELEPLGAKQTRVRLSMIGYGTGKGFDDIYGFFVKGNPWTLEKLAERFETGPIDWKKALAKPAH